LQTSARGGAYRYLFLGFSETDVNQSKQKYHYENEFPSPDGSGKPCKIDLYFFIAIKERPTEAPFIVIKKQGYEQA
jgi:hypothetical protein